MAKITKCAYAIQILLFVLARLLDDMSWYDIGVKNEVNIFQGTSLASICSGRGGYRVFGCHVVNEHNTYFFVKYTGCCINITQIILTNVNFSLICNTKAEKAELIIYEAVIFGEIFYNGDLIILFIEGMEGKEKDMAIIFISIVIANQVLIMDLIFRAAYEDKEREEEKEEQLLGHDFPHMNPHYRAHPHPTTIVTQQNSMNYALQIQPSEQKR